MAYVALNSFKMAFQNSKKIYKSQIVFNWSFVNEGL